MSDPLWNPGTFLIATGFGPDTTDGFVYRGLGMWKIMKASPKGRRPPRWHLTHLGSGHAVCVIAAHMVKAFGIATEIAECGDWGWDGLAGYLNRDPDILRRCVDIIERHKNHVLRLGCTASKETAREIAIARA